MPGHASSPYWAAVDFDSEGEESASPGSSQRVYVDPWGSENYALRTENGDSSQPETSNSFAGEPVSASFYYVPTKSDYSEEEAACNGAMEGMAPDYPMAPVRRRSRAFVQEIPAEMPAYGYDMVVPNRRRSLYVEDPIYMAHPLIYEGVYGHGPGPVPPPGYVPIPRQRASLPAHPAAVDYAMASLARNGKHRRHSRYVEMPDRYAYEAMIPEYEDWCRPPVIPKAAPENFHLSRYGHLQIDYSCSWNSLDRLIRNQQRC